MHARSLASIALMIAAPALAQMLGPTPYLSDADSPFDQVGGTFFLEDFEDGLFNTPGVTAVPGGVVCGCGGLNDSVDGDDGSIDGMGQAGRSFFGGPPQEFTFSADPFGRLPTHAGLVWTDGGTDTLATFEAYDGSDTLIGSVSATLGDASNAGTTAEDRFFGVIHAQGIGRIVIRHTSGGLEVDHLQYGVAEASCAADMNGDGQLNIFDFLAFQTAFSNEDPRADLAAPFGVFNIFDFLAFQTAFGNGC